MKNYTYRDKGTESPVLSAPKERGVRMHVPPLRSPTLGELEGAIRILTQ